EQSVCEVVPRLDRNHLLAGRSCSVSARGLGAQPGTGIDVSVPRCATEWSTSANCDTTRTASVGGFFSKDKRLCIGDQASPEWGDHDGFGSNRAIAEW